MNTVYNKIQELLEVTAYSKHEQIVNGVINAIDERIVIQGSMLPSVNSMVRALGFASKTIVKAYKELKDRGIVDSKNRLGYFVVNEDTDQIKKVALLIYAFHPFQEEFYNSFRDTLGENIQVDVFFHHNNLEIFETILGNISGRYGMYVVAPIVHPRVKKILSKIPSRKLLIVDRYEELDGEFSHITQEFEISTYMMLKALLDKIRAYDGMTLYFLPESDHPVEILRAFKKFLQDYEITGSVETHYKPGQLIRGHLYFTVGDGDLWKLLKDVKKEGLVVGEDVGVLSNDNSPVKEIICGGITTFSTDFELMGSRAAEFVLEGNSIQEVIPTVLIQRKSI